MTAAWDRFLATGSGLLQFRLQIEGFPYEPVSSRAMESTATDGRIRYAGLDSSRIKLKETVDLVRAKWEPQGFRVELVDRNRQWTEAFRKPTAVTYLGDTALTAAATTVNVKATGQFAATGKVWINTEVMSYSGKTGTSFTGLTRGVYETLAQKHFTLDGERARRPEVTNWPRVREGRRVALYVYASGDDLDSTSPTAGTKIWTGVVQTEPQFDGLSWSFSIDPITRKWDQDIGGDLEDPTRIRGIYYPAYSPLVIQVFEMAGAGPGGAFAARTFFRLAGFWETQEAFLIDLNAEIVTQLAAPMDGSFTQTVVAVARGGSWAMQFVTASTPNEKWMFCEAYSGVDLISRTLPLIDVGTGFATGTVGPDQRKEWRQNPGMGLVPRAMIGIGPGSLWTGVVGGSRDVNIDEATFPNRRIYLGNAVGVTASTNSVSIEWESTENNYDYGITPLSEPFVAKVSTVDTTNRYIELFSVPTFATADVPEKAHYAACGSDIVSIRMGREYGTGTLANFILNVNNDVPGQLNAGGVPDIRAADFVGLGTTDILAAASMSPLTQDRQYTVFAPVSFAELVEHECRLLGVFPGYDSSGKVTFRAMRLAVSGEVAVKTITGADILTGDGEWLGYEVAPLGQFNTVSFKTGYDPVEEEHTGPTAKVRDLASWAQNPDGRVLEVEPKSIDREGGFAFADIVRQFGRILGVFGGPYAYLTIGVKFTLFSVLAGDIVKITWNKVPNSDGTLGVTNKTGFVVAREWDFADAGGKLTIMVTDANVAGYAPATKLTITDGTSGTTGPFTATANDDYFPGSTTAADHWDSGDLVRLFRYDDTTTATNVTATIDSEPVGDTLIFTTDSNWTHAGSTWVLGSQVSTALTAANQKAPCFVANADTTLDYSGDTGNPAQTLA